MSGNDQADGAEGAHPEIEASFDDLADGALPEAEAAKVRAHLAGCPACAAAHAAHQRTLAALAGLAKPGAPPRLSAEVAATIHRRSGGRFFGRRAFGDRVPFEVLAIVALVVAVIIFFLARASATGSLRLDRDRGAPPPGLELEGGR
jgi:anti-sigma factor RsiW